MTDEREIKRETDSRRACACAHHSQSSLFFINTRSCSLANSTHLEVGNVNNQGVREGSALGAENFLNRLGVVSVTAKTVDSLSGKGKDATRGDYRRGRGDAGRGGGE